MHSGCFCYRSNNVWFWKEQGLVSFAEMKCPKCKKKKALTTPPLPFLCVMIKTYETARSHSLPLSKKDIGISNHPWVVYIYICSAPPKQKTKKTKKTEPWGLQDLQWVWFLWILCFFLFLFSPRGPPQRVSKYFLLVQ